MTLPKKIPITIALLGILGTTSLTADIWSEEPFRIGSLAEVGDICEKYTGVPDWILMVRDQAMVDPTYLDTIPDADWEAYVKGVEYGRELLNEYGGCITVIKFLSGGRPVQ